MEFDFTNPSILKEAARAIRIHNRIHSATERNAVLITEYLSFAAHLIDELANGNVIIARRGRWIEGTSRGSYSIYCSYCKSHKETTCPSDYCPNCGAVMDLRAQTEAASDATDGVMMRGE